MKTDYPEDIDCTDPLESRQFYELMQAYRWSKVDAHPQFEAVKAFIRESGYDLETARLQRLEVRL